MTKTKLPPKLERPTYVEYLRPGQSGSISLSDVLVDQEGVVRVWKKAPVGQCALVEVTGDGLLVLRVPADARFERLQLPDGGEEKLAEVSDLLEI